MMVEGSAFTRNDVFQMAIRVAFVSAVTYFSIKWLVNQIDPTSKSRKKAEERAREQLRKYVSIGDLPMLASVINLYHGHLGFLKY